MMGKYKGLDLVYAEGNALFENLKDAINISSVENIGNNDRNSRCR